MVVFMQVPEVMINLNIVGFQEYIIKEIIKYNLYKKLQKSQYKRKMWFVYCIAQENIVELDSFK